MTNDVFSFNTSNFNKYLVGFDKVLDTLQNVNETMMKSAHNWPPYNIVKVDDNNYRIELAVSGFGKNDIDIELANNTLIVKGGLTLDDLDEKTNPVTYLYRGIAERAFSRKFTLADHVEVKNAEFFNGMLRIWLKHMIPEKDKPKKIQID